MSLDRFRLPFFNNQLSSDEDNFESPLVSPRVPRQSTAASPVRHRPHSANTSPNGVQVQPDPSAVLRQASRVLASQQAPARMVNYDEATLAPGERQPDNCLENGIRALKGYEFDEQDLKFYFQQCELRMQEAGVKKNYTKFQVLVAILPKKVIDQVKPLLRKDETELGATPYKTLKTQIIKRFGPPQNADFERAMGRVLSGKPSELCRNLIDDLCEHELVGCCCKKFIVGLWHRQLPSNVRQGISHLEFNADNLDEILKRADDWFTSGQKSVLVTPGVSAMRSSAAPQPPTYWVATEPPPMDDAFHQDWGNVHAMNWQRGRGGWRGGPGRGQGGRGGQRGGRGGGRGANSNNNQSGGQSGGQNKGQSGGQGQGQTHPRHKGPRHADNPPLSVCVKHWVHGKSAHWCQEPVTCPWRDYYVPKANNQ